MPAAKANPKTRRRILDLLKQSGPQDAATLAQECRISAMAVRQHLYQLQDEQLVTFEEQPRPKGRPAKMWRLTDDADRFFPDGHARLSVDLMSSLATVFGSNGLAKLVAERAKQQSDEYKSRLPKRASLKRKLAALAKIRTEEGYMAEVQLAPDGGYLLIENHCPICTAATSCTGLCSAEMEVFQSVLGDDVSIERTEHILDGARRCVYSVR